MDRSFIHMSGVFLRQTVVAVLSALSFVSCGNDEMLEASLEFAGENRAELQRVLDHYKDDPVKYRSAVAIIRNLPHWYSYRQTPDLDSIEHMLGIIAHNKDIWYFKGISDKDWKNFSYANIPRIYDSHAVTAEYLFSGATRKTEGNMTRRDTIFSVPAGAIPRHCILICCSFGCTALRATAFPRSGRHGTYWRCRPRCLRRPRRRYAGKP